eukprot:EG_transcript_2919
MALSPEDEALLLEQVALCRQELATAPADPPKRRRLAVLLSDVGTQLKLTKRLAEAETSYMEALTFDEKYQDAYYNLGVLFGEQGQVDKATQCYAKALECCPLYADAHCNLGVIRKEQGRLEEARQHYLAALITKPNFELVKMNLAIVLTDLGSKAKVEGNLALASEFYNEALLHQPFYADAYFNLGVLYSEAQMHAKAVYFYQMALHFNPNNSRALNNLGITYKNLDNMERSVECFTRCLEVSDPSAPTPNPVVAHAMNNLGMIYMLVGKDDEALHYFQKTIDLDPNYAAAYNNMGVVLRDEGKVKEAIAYYDKCIALCKDLPERLAHHNKLLAANYDIERTLDEIQRLHLDWGRAFCDFTAPHCWRTWANPKEKEKRLVIGYVSPDFFYHSVSYFIHSVLLYHTHQKFKIVCFANQQRCDEKTARFRQLADVWHDISDKNTAQVCHLIVQEGVDILVDLTGHTSNHRLDVFSCKPAPIQFTWIGYPNTTGLPTIDYRFTDSYTDPPETTDPAHYSETLIRLDPCFLCYNPDSPPFWELYPHPQGPDLQRIYREQQLQQVHPDVSPPPCLRSGFITVGTFNSISKITRDVAEVWSEILKQVPEMRVVLKSKPLACERVRRDMTTLFTVHGIAPERINCAGIIPIHNAHLSAYNEMDICLDCWPYAGTATSCEALYMGCPLVTLKGAHHVQNVGVSLLNTIGFPELVTETKEEYIRVVVELARDTERMARYRKEIRQRMLQSPLCDGAKYVEQVEGHFRRVWHTYCDQQPSPSKSPVPMPAAREAPHANGSCAETAPPPPPEMSNGSLDVKHPAAPLVAGPGAGGLSPDPVTVDEARGSE